MKEFRQHLDKASFNALAVLIVSKIQSLYSPDCDVEAGSALITAPSVSIPAGQERFVVLGNDWADTPEELTICSSRCRFAAQLNSGVMQLEESDEPRNPKLQSKTGSKSQNSMRSSRPGNRQKPAEG